MTEPLAPGPEGVRPLVYRVAAMGDTILLTGLLRALALRWGRPCDVVVKAPWDSAILAGLDSVAETIALNSRRTPYPLSRPQQRLVKWLRQRPPGPVYFVDGLDKEAWLLRRGAVSPDHMVTQREVPWPLRQHHLDHLLEYARHLPPSPPIDGLMPMPEPPPRPELVVFPDEIEDCRAWLAAMGWEGEPIVAFQTQTRRTNKGRWPVPSWCATIRAVLDRVPGAWGLLIGSAKEARDVRLLADDLDDARVRVVAGQFGNLRRLFALLSMAHSCVSMDTGPGHAAVTLGCPTAVIFGTGHPDRYRPVGPPEVARFVTALPEAEWPDSQPQFAAVHHIEDITPGQVVEAWERLAHRSGELAADS